MTEPFNFGEKPKSEVLMAITSMISFSALRNWERVDEASMNKGE